MFQNKIFFIATYSYLAIPQYKAITPFLKSYHNILLNVKDPLSITFDMNHITQDIITRYFDEYIELKDVSFNIKGIRAKIQNYKNYQKKILAKLELIKPKAIISCSDMTLSDRIISSWCLNNNVPFIIIQPAVLGGEHSFGEKSLGRYSLKHQAKRVILKRFIGVPLLRRQHLFGNESQRTHLLFWSEYFVRNPDRKKTTFVGNPAYDELFKKFQNNNSRTLKNNILICTQDIEQYYGQEKVEQIIDMYKKAITSNPELGFYIKVHPRESIQKYKNIFNENDFPNIKIVKDHNLHDLFEICDIQISFASTTSIEAVIFGLPIIIINPDNSFKLVDHFRGEIDIRVTNVNSMPKAIATALSNDYWEIFLRRREKFIQKMFHSADGRSGERAAIKIRELISQDGIDE